MLEALKKNQYTDEHKYVLSPLFHGTCVLLHFL